MKPEDTDEAIKSAIQGDLERFMRDEPSIVGDVISGRNPSTPCVHDPVTCWWCQNPSVTPRVPYAKVEDMRRVKREMDAHNMNGGTVRLQAAEDGEC